MTENEIRGYIFSTLARLYEDPMHRTQYKRFTFQPADRKLAREILSQLTKNYIVEQKESDVVRLTELGYQLIQSDLSKQVEKATGSDKDTSKQNLLPPAAEEIEKVSQKLNKPDYISASHYTMGQAEIFWATEGFKKFTGYSIEDLKKEGGSVALFRGLENQKKLETIFRELVNNGEVRDEIDIITKNGNKRKIRFVARARYDSNNQIAGTITAVKGLKADG